jgi:hypothetical protein
LPKELEYTNPQADIAESTAQRNLFHSGIGSGKSHIMGALSIEYCINNPEVRGFIGANTYGQLTKSTLDRVFKVWEGDFGLKRGVHYVVDHIPPPSYKIFGPKLKTYENTISFNNGAMIFLASLDNYKVIDGTEFGWAMLDETKDTKEEAIKEVIVARLRQLGMFISPSGVISKTMKPGYLGFNPLYIFTSPAKSKWLMEWFDLDKYVHEIEASIYSKTDYFRKRIGDKLVVISSTYHNEHNLPPGKIDSLMEDYSKNQNLINMQIYGSPFSKSGGEFYHGFSRMEHVKNFEPWNDLPVHLSFDFNLVPYITCTCWQIKHEEGHYLVRCFREFCLPNPNNNSEALAEEILRKIPHLLKNGVYIYGDYSGKTNNTVTKDVRNNYEMIKKVLYKYLNNHSDRVVKNAMHIKRRDFANKMLTGGFNITIEIDERCKEMIGDFEFLKESPEGGKLKEKKNGAEVHGHTSDTLDGFITSAFDYLFT